MASQKMFLIGALLSLTGIFAARIDVGKIAGVDIGTALFGAGIAIMIEGEVCA